MTNGGTVVNTFPVEAKLVDEMVRKQSEDPVIKKLMEEVKVQRRVELN